MKALKIKLLTPCCCLVIHPRKLTCPLKRDYFNRKYIFQPSLFRDMLAFRGPGSNLIDYILVPTPPHPVTVDIG